jgi:hypothetical protein
VIVGINYSSLKLDAYRVEPSIHYSSLKLDAYRVEPSIHYKPETSITSLSSIDDEEEEHII